MIRAIVAAVALVCVSSCHPALADIPALVTQAAQSAGVPTDIAHAVIRYESKYRPHVRGMAGEWGLGQIKCQTARGLGFRGSCGALANPSENLRWSMKYLRMALDKGGSGCSGVSLYQTGIHVRPRCSAYGRAVMQMAARLQ
jgi:soluble lytic murein transglycosylase-like protein